MNNSQHTPASRTRLLDFKSAGWVIVIALLLVGGIVAWRVGVIVSAERYQGWGDGTHVDSYGFDLSNCIVPRELLVAAGFSKDGLAPLDDFVVADAQQVEEINRTLRKAHIGKALVSDELVIGVEIGGEARAYPTRILALHEIFPDTLGQTPILVTYNPLCDAAVVFDRRVNGEVMDFGVSGLLYNSNLLLYDKREQHGAESLWSQLEGRAAAGPRVGTALRMLPMQVTTWGEWLEMHPDSHAVLPAGLDYKRYKRVSYALYESTGKPQFPIARPSPLEHAPMTHVTALRVDGQWRVFALDDVAARVDANGVWRTHVDDYELTLRYHHNPPCATFAIDPTPADLAALRCYWFAWNAMLWRNQTAEDAEGAENGRENQSDH